MSAKPQALKLYATSNDSTTPIILQIIPLLPLFLETELVLHYQDKAPSLMLFIIFSLTLMMDISLLLIIIWQELICGKTLKTKPMHLHLLILSLAKQTSPIPLLIAIILF
jgi:hypothetical protein